MIDYRIFTFLTLCEQMNYHKTADILNITQPAVTQHIHYLESLYKCKLFCYNKKKLTKTTKGAELEKRARSIVSLSLSAAQTLSENEKRKLNLGATKTIGEYTIESMVSALVSDETLEFNLLIDNTQKLLEKLHTFEIDLLMLEGYIDKNQYGHQLISKEEIVGVCAKTHVFANQELSLEDIFNETLILREKGSGTRDVFEHFLLQQNFSIDSFAKTSVISSNKLIENIVENKLAIAFVYDIVPRKNPRLSTFKIKNHKILHEFNFVFLKNTKADELIRLLEGKLASIL